MELSPTSRREPGLATDATHGHRATRRARQARAATGRKERPVSVRDQSIQRHFPTISPFAARFLRHIKEARGFSPRKLAGTVCCAICPPNRLSQRRCAGILSVLGHGRDARAPSQYFGTLGSTWSDHARIPPLRLWILRKPDFIRNSTACALRMPERQ